MSIYICIYRISVNISVRYSVVCVCLCVWCMCVLCVCTPGTSVVILQQLLRLATSTHTRRSSSGSWTQRLTSKHSQENSNSLTSRGRSDLLTALQIEDQCQFGSSPHQQHFALTFYSGYLNISQTCHLRVHRTMT